MSADSLPSKFNPTVNPMTPNPTQRETEELGLSVPRINRSIGSKSRPPRSPPMPRDRTSHRVHLGAAFKAASTSMSLNVNTLRGSTTDRPVDWRAPSSLSTDVSSESP